MSVPARNATVDILSDDVLLLIFHLDGLEDLDRVTFPYPDGAALNGLLYLSWHRLIHVCRRWRSLVFASPNFLGLRLICGPRTHMELTGIWPPLPIILRNTAHCTMAEDYDFDSAIMHCNRLCQIDLHLSSSQLQRLASAMQVQFPALMHLSLSTDIGVPIPALPNGFLGGIAPHLQSLELYRIPFPALPKLLLSATDLAYLILWDIPQSLYTSPEAIVTSLAVLANLKSLTIQLKHPLSLPDQHPPPPTRTAFSALTHFEFEGHSEYLEDFMARIDTPLLDSICIDFCELIPHSSHLAQFMRRTPKFQALNEAHVNFDDGGIRVESLPPMRTFVEKSGLRISCEEFDEEFSSPVRVLTSIFPSIYIVEHLYIYASQNLLSLWQHTKNMPWLEILQPFTSVRNLYISRGFAQCIAPALQELVEERARDVLPALERLFLEELRASGPVEEAIGQFVAARQLSSHPVAVSQRNEA